MLDVAVLPQGAGYGVGESFPPVRKMRLRGLHFSYRYRSFL